MVRLYNKMKDISYQDIIDNRQLHHSLLWQVLSTTIDQDSIESDLMLTAFHKYIQLLENPTLKGIRQEPKYLWGYIGDDRVLWLHNNDLENLEDIFENVCVEGKLEVAQWVVQWMPNIHATDKDVLFIDVCSSGHLQTAKWLKDSWPEIDHRLYEDSAFRQTCENGHLAIAQWLKSTWPSIDESSMKNYAFIQACKHGHLHTAKWLKTAFHHIDQNVCEYEVIKTACRRGHFKVVQWLVSFNDYSQCNLEPYTAKHTEIAQWLISMGVTKVDETLVYACAQRNKNLAFWLTSKLIVIPESNTVRILRTASNDTDILHHIIKRYPGISQTLKMMLDHEIVEMLQRTYKSAKDTALQCVQWLEDHHTFDDNTYNNIMLYYVCEHGGIETVQHLLNKWHSLKKQPNLDEAFGYACEGNNFTVAKWLLDHNASVRFRYSGCYLTNICIRGHLQMMKWIHKKWPSNHPKWDATFQLACSQNILDVARFIQSTHRINSNNQNKAFYNACSEGHVEVAKWLISVFPTIDYNMVQVVWYRQKTPLCSAIESSKLQMVKWLIRTWPVLRHNVCWQHDNIIYSEESDKVNRWLRLNI